MLGGVATTQIGRDGLEVGVEMLGQFAHGIVRRL
jgi:hypothetical protein